MKKTTKRLKLNIETLRSLDLHEVTGGTFTFTFTAASKPNASCFIQCTPTNNCPVTQTCPLATANC